MRRVRVKLLQLQSSLLFLLFSYKKFRRLDPSEYGPLVM